ncbi:Sensor protein CreC [Serratia entomophila]|uniref:two-component system sensor histidine kinase CreC n=1 Tax=Serratia entomophila TaxID=42906 RepID=UPI001F3212CE|nr:two-component system sensor histidine kinase CreC [Serratia entomophila]UIW17595.1 two-component system sensor histidine kinase CreC [Serratia entomophila]CAI0702549.1 Sensor protein CreC [Serratia entomophila]CAI0778965.1 Sensor protein CreC [Serratia entomophila]CAI0965010.1 Sensor protein CreC [Serratia entomophila]CAI0965305.1 Sensor protein CreC [Serratia entomophila]
MRIGLRLLLGYFLIVAVAGYFVLSIFVQEVKPGVRRATEGTLVDTANLLAQIARQDMQRGDAAHGQLAQAFSQLNQRPIGANIAGIRKDRSEYHVYLTDARGTVIFDSAGQALGRDYSRWNDVHLTLRGQYGARSTRSDPQDENSSVMYVAAPVMAQGKIIGVLSVGKPNSTMAPVIKRSERRILLAGALLLGIALLIGLGFVWWISRSIGHLVRYADGVAQGERAPLPKVGGRELTQLAQAVESMRLKLEGKAYIEQYVHTLTHELKSPLAAIRGAAELLQELPPPQTARRFLTNIEQQSARIQQLVDKLLVQARLESRPELDLAPVAIAGLVRQSLAGKEAQAAQRGVRLQLAELPEVTLIGDALLISQALNNLLENALDFTPPGGTIAVRGERREQHYRIDVCDDGSGIPDYALDKVFERFYSLARADRPKSSGLGLNFVQEVARLHRGSISLRNRQPHGVAAIFTLSL